MSTIEAHILFTFPLTWDPRGGPLPRRQRNASFFSPSLPQHNSLPTRNPHALAAKRLPQAREALQQILALAVVPRVVLEPGIIPAAILVGIDVEETRRGVDAGDLGALVGQEAAVDARDRSRVDASAVRERVFLGLGRRVADLAAAGHGVDFEGGDVLCACGGADCEEGEGGEDLLGGFRSEKGWEVCGVWGPSRGWRCA